MVSKTQIQLSEDKDLCLWWWEKEKEMRAAAHKQRDVPVDSRLSGSTVVLFSLHSPTHQNLQTQYHLFCLIVVVCLVIHILSNPLISQNCTFLTKHIYFQLQIIFKKSYATSKFNTEEPNSSSILRVTVTYLTSGFRSLWDCLCLLWYLYLK